MLNQIHVHLMYMIDTDLVVTTESVLSLQILVVCQWMVKIGSVLFSLSHGSRLKGGEIAPKKTPGL